MPTHQDETLPQRYAREHQDYLKLCGSMTAEQVADLQLQLHNSLAREAALQQRLTAADERADVLEGRVSMLLRELKELINDDDGILVAAELSTGFAWHALQKHCKAIKATLKAAEGRGDESI